MCRRAILLISFVLVLSLNGNVQAEDLNPPDFAGADGWGAAAWEFEVEPPEPTAFAYKPEMLEPEFLVDGVVGGWWNEGAQALDIGGEGRFYLPVPEGEGGTMTMNIQITWEGDGDVWAFPEIWSAPDEEGGEYHGGNEGIDPEIIDLGGGMWHGTWYGAVDGASEYVVALIGGEGVAIHELVVDAVVHDGDPPVGTGQRPGTALEPELAADPSPADEEADVPLEVVLGWTPGTYANQHDVYFGTNLNDVNEASPTVDPNNVYQSRQGAASYSVPGTLDYGQTYYWRIDEVNAPPDNTVYKGHVWSFTTEPYAYPIEDIIVTSSGDEGPDSPDPNLDNVINGSGIDEDDMHSTDPEDMWLTQGADGAWIQFEFDKAYKLNEMLVWNYNEPWESILGFGFNAVVIEYSSNGTDFTTLDTVQAFDQAPGQLTGPTTVVDFGDAIVTHVKINANSNFGSTDKFGLSEVRFLYIPVRAREPEPADGAEDVPVDAALGWRAGREANTHDVLIGTANDDLTLVGDDITEASFMPDLILSETYYWQVLETDVADLAGDIWSFSTQEFLVVDDFESYNDLNPDDPESNRIFLTWIGGDVDPANGSQVGHDSFPFAELEIVHSDDQSMPLYYDNSNASFSEVTVNPADLPVGPDWTRADIKALTLYVHGSEDNLGGQFYVKVNGAKQDQSTDLAGAYWQEVNIDLASFGVDLSSATSLTLGVEGPGSSGLIYVDDIRLYPSRCMPEKVLGDLTGDCIVDSEDLAVIADNWLVRPLSVEYTFDTSLSDTSGNARHGVGQNNPTVAGGILTLNGTNFVDIPLGSDNPFDGSRDFSVAMDFKASTPSILLSSARDGEPDNHSMSLFVHHWDEPYWGEVIYDNFWIGGAAAEDDPLDGEWHTVVVTYDADSEWFIVYLDGMAGEGTEMNPDIPDIAADTVRIGGSLNVGYPYEEGVSDLVGDIDNTRIFNFTLTQEDVHRLPAVPTGPADLNGDGIVDQADQDIVESNMGPEKLWP
jgi:hypothetical protein